jgi:hypothetical protein
MLPVRAAKTGGCSHAQGCKCAPVMKLQPFRAASKAAKVGPVRLVLTKATEGEKLPDGVCEIDALEGCSLADLELMYVDALWNYYHPDTKGTFTMSDADFDRLKDELYWQASGFPTLQRDEIEFVEASIAYARGEPVMSDGDYETLKNKVRSRGEKRADVTALLLYTKGQQLLDPDEYDKLSAEMLKLGIEVGLKGASCTLNKTPEELTPDSEALTRMYAGLGAFPTLITFAVISILNAPWHGFHPYITGSGFLMGVGISAASTYALVRYLGLHNTQILVGKCPCCEADMKQLFAGDEPPEMYSKNCPVCGTGCEISRKENKMKLAGGDLYINA